MSSPSTLSVSSVLRKLGVRSRRVMPEYRTSDMQPVVLLADMSRSYAPEAVEARSIGGQEWTPGGVFTYHSYQLLARGSGGIIVEALGCSATVAGRGFVEILGAPVPGMFAAPPPLQIGGELTSSALSRRTEAGIIGSPVLIATLPLVVPTDRVFVPAGSYIHFGTAATVAANYTSNIRVVWREVPEMLGPS